MTRIGVVTDGGEIVIRDSKGELMDFGDAGYEHF